HRLHAVRAQPSTLFVAGGLSRHTCDRTAGPGSARARSRSPGRLDGGAVVPVVHGCGRARRAGEVRPQRATHRRKPRRGSQWLRRTGRSGHPAGWSGALALRSSGPHHPLQDTDPMPLEIRDPAGCRWDLVSLGEVMLRLDPGEGRIATTRSFHCWEGGGEYNVARALRRCFRLRTAIVTALADNHVGRLIEDLMLQGGVDLAHLHWVPHDGVGRTVRNGLNFTERGFGIRGAIGVSDRGHTAVSQLKPGDIDWDLLFDQQGARWFHTGGIFAALSDSTPDVAREAM